MKALLHRFPAVLALVAMLTLFASCGKDALVEPCNHSAVAEGKASSADPGGEDTAADAASSGESDPDGSGISDDGDDLSGSERNKKKRSN
jgi:hypothetical protein